MAQEALGMVETRGLTAAIEAAFLRRKGKGNEHQRDDETKKSLVFEDRETVFHNVLLLKKVEYEIIYFSTILARDRLKSKGGRGTPQNMHLLLEIVREICILYHNIWRKSCNC